jgi:hypothetical protein
MGALDANDRAQGPEASGGHCCSPDRRSGGRAGDPLFRICRDPFHVPRATVLPRAFLPGTH